MLGFVVLILERNLVLLFENVALQSWLIVVGQARGLISYRLVLANVSSIHNLM